MKFIKITSLALLTVFAVSMNTFAAGIELGDNRSVGSQTSNVLVGSTEQRPFENVIYNNSDDNADLQVYAIDSWTTTHEGTVAENIECADDGLSGKMYRLGLESDLKKNTTTKFAFGYSYKSQPGGKSFGITNDNVYGTTLSFDIKLSDESIYDNATIRFGYNGSIRDESSSMGNFGRYADKILRFSDYAERTTQWQTVKIPLSEFEGITITNTYFIQISNSWGSETLDWKKINMFALDFGEKKENTYVYLRNVKFVSEKEVSCAAESALYADGAEMAADVAEFAGKRAMLAVKYSNEKATDENVLYAAALYKNGVMIDLKTITVTFVADSNGVMTHELFDIPENTNGISIGFMTLAGMSFSKPLADWINFE